MDVVHFPGPLVQLRELPLDQIARYLHPSAEGAQFLQLGVLPLQDVHEALVVVYAALDERFEL